MSNPEPFGHAMRDNHFTFDKSYHPMNHGSFGAFPKSVRERQRELQDLTESRPDTFLRYTYPELLDESRHAIAPLLGANPDEVVFVPNATTGVNTVLRNLVYQKGDVIVHFSTIYGACEKTIASICETSPADMASISIEYPLEDEEIIQKFLNMVGSLAKEGKRIKIVMFDTVITFPGVRFPWEAMVSACKDLGVLSLIDGAHGIGHIDLTRLGDVGPDFFTSNCYKWLYVPRGCAVLYVPARNQALIRTTFPTSHGFQTPSNRKLQLGGNSSFVELFKKVSTVDPTPFVCVPEALKFREGKCGGEERIRDYCQHIALIGGRRMAEVLHTEILENKSNSINQCSFVNVRLPLTVVSAQDVSVPVEIGHPRISIDDAPGFAKWITERAVKDYDTMIPTKFYAGAIWSRLSGQIYLEVEDFEWAAHSLQEMCQRVMKGESR